MSQLPDIKQYVLGYSAWKL